MITSDVSRISISAKQKNKRNKKLSKIKKKIQGHKNEKGWMARGTFTIAIYCNMILCTTRPPTSMTGYYPHAVARFPYCGHRNITPNRPRNYEFWIKGLALTHVAMQTSQSFVSPVFQFFLPALSATNMDHSSIVVWTFYEWVGREISADKHSMTPSFTPILE